MATPPIRITVSVQSIVQSMISSFINSLAQTMNIPEDKKAALMGSIHYDVTSYAHGKYRISASFDAGSLFNMAQKPDFVERMEFGGKLSLILDVDVVKMVQQNRGIRVVAINGDELTLEIDMGALVDQLAKTGVTQQAVPLPIPVTSKPHISA